MNQGNRRWGRTLAGAVLGCATGISALLLYTNGLFVAGLSHDFGLSRTQFGFGVLLVTMALAAANPLVGWAVDRFNARGPCHRGTGPVGAGLCCDRCVRVFCEQLPADSGDGGIRGRCLRTYRIHEDHWGHLRQESRDCAWCHHDGHWYFRCGGSPAACVSHCHSWVACRVLRPGDRPTHRRTRYRDSHSAPAQPHAGECGRNTPRSPRPAAGFALPSSGRWRPRSPRCRSLSLACSLTSSPCSRTVV